jgi:hypothetical protein
VGQHHRRESAYQFNDGSGSFDGNNTVTVSGFNVAGVGAATSSNGGSGDLSSSIVLTDSGFFNEVFQQFTPVGTLQFQVSLTTNVDRAPRPTSSLSRLCMAAVSSIFRP